MPSKKERIAQLAAQFARDVSAEIYGENGPNDNDDIDVIEEHAVQASRAAFDAVIARQLELQKQRLPKHLACLKCGARCSTETEDRIITGRFGSAAISEAKAHCSVCDRDFFPSAGNVAAGQ
jgi:hypothetical protein